jgi:hypothetical protein
MDINADTFLKNIDQKLDQRLPFQNVDPGTVVTHRDQKNLKTDLNLKHTRLDAAAKRWSVQPIDRLDKKTFPDPDPPAFPHRFIGDGTRREYRETISGWTE